LVENNKAHPVMFKLKVSRTAHVFESGDPNTAQTGWLVCHGYGQLASRFIRKFDILQPEAHYILAPEGLSKFYWNGFEGPVVASWMTKEHREDEIDDHCAYLDQLYPKISSYPRKVILGFSQGVATVIRYLDRYPNAWDHVVLIGGWLPEDVDHALWYEKLPGTTFWILNGDSDQYYPEERILAQETNLRAKGMQFQSILFEGGHDIPGQALMKLVDSWSVQD